MHFAAEAYISTAERVLLIAHLNKNAIYETFGLFSFDSSKVGYRTRELLHA